MDDAAPVFVRREQEIGQQAGMTARMADRV
jgi:hypothetical protein